MGYSRPDEEFRADHARDHAKHDRPKSHRLDRPISTAMDIAVCVRGMANIQEAADLIELYARMVATGAASEATADAARTFGVALELPLARKDPEHA